METKTCSKCKQAKPITEFYHRKPGNTLHSACKMCEREMAKDWYLRNTDKAKSKYREWRKDNPDAVKEYRSKNRAKAYQQELMRKYNVDSDWFEQQIKRQDGKCECCGKQFEIGNKHTTPHLDHCHKTQQVRGILCNRCNSVLGLCEDDADLLASLERYLRKCHG